MPARRRLLAIALGALYCIPVIVRADDSPFIATRVVLGVGAGAMHVDLPDPDAGGESFGTCPRVQFALGYQARPWFELGAELGFTYLPESDSLNAILTAQGSQERALRTHLQAFADARLRWLHGDHSWAPFARAGIGVASLRTSAGDIAEERETDPAWNAGGGVDWFVHRHILVRLEGLYIGQAVENGGSRTHAAACLTVHYALHASQLGLGH